MRKLLLFQIVIVLNDFFECLRFSCIYNKGSEIISVVVYILKNIFTLLFLMPFVDSRHLLSNLDFFTLDSRHFYSRLSTFLLSTLDFLLSTLDFYSRLSTFTLDSRQLLSTLDIYSRPSTFRYTLQKVEKVILG